MSYSLQPSGLWAHQAPLSMVPSSRDLPYPGVELMSLTSPALAGRFFTTSNTWEARLKLAQHCKSTIMKKKSNKICKINEMHYGLNSFPLIFFFPVSPFSVLCACCYQRHNSQMDIANEQACSERLGSVGWLYMSPASGSY